MSGTLSTTPPAAHSLAGIELLRDLDDVARQRLERRCAWARWNPGEHIIDRESASNDVYFIVRGRARVVEFSESGSRDVVLDEIGAGGYFGELAAIDGEPRSTNVVAAELTVTASLSPQDFIDMLFEHRDVGLAFMCRLTEMVRASTLRIVDLSLRDAQKRVYAELLRQAKTGGGGKPNTGFIRPVPVHGDIAARVSTTRETVARTISDLTHRGIVERKDDALHIYNLEQLTRLAGRLA
jgi:CRP/FNR family transcriptional regulator, cyclic AMP receptor protein